LSRTRLAWKRSNFRNIAVVVIGAVLEFVRKTMLYGVGQPGPMTCATRS
jgi:hypothetical protein